MPQCGPNKKICSINTNIVSFYVGQCFLMCGRPQRRLAVHVRISKALREHIHSEERNPRAKFLVNVLLHNKDYRKCINLHIEDRHKGHEIGRHFIAYKAPLYPAGLQKNEPDLNSKTCRLIRNYGYSEPNLSHVEFCHLFSSKSWNNLYLTCKYVISLA